RGEIRVDLKWHRSAIEMSVSDTGVGIAPEHFERLFNAYSQVDQKSGQRFIGTGLGLTLTHKFCVLLGGDISVESTPGEGTTFSVFLPHCPPKCLPVHGIGERIQAFARPVEVQTDRGAGRILVIDDDTRTQASLSSLLEGAGYRVEGIRSMAQGLERVRQNPPDLVILDILSNDMPHAAEFANAVTNGWAVLDSLVEESCNIPVVVLSMLRARQRALGQGAAAFLSKPAEPQTILALMHTWVRQGDSAADVRT
ncbi:MAG: ATP-binding response regulator, partial [Nannocystaceae bacterium]